MLTAPASDSVREACLRVARDMIIAEGSEKLSIREVARTLGISHQTPYRHFESRDHLVAEVIGRCFSDFGRHLRSATEGIDEPISALLAMGQAYLAYVRDYPRLYRILFVDPLPPPEEFPDMVRCASDAFDALRGSLSTLYASQGRRDPLAEAQRNALHIWATLHGLGTLLSHPATRAAELPSQLTDEAPFYAFACLKPLLLPDGQSC
ncbi:MAG: TetR/AcrR family transcriptional regulator [Caulobacteraceae bacterium]|nr:TetR/AcrR family transcriptional regulator [Caulobacteraceae bacterium]